MKTGLKTHSGRSREIVNSEGSMSIVQCVRRDEELYLRSHPDIHNDEGRKKLDGICISSP